MAEDTKQTLGRLAKALRSEAAEAQAKQLREHGEIRDRREQDRDWQRGRQDGLNEAADLLDDGKGG